MIGRLYQESVFLNLGKNNTARFCVFPMDNNAFVYGSDPLLTSRCKYFDSSDKNELVLEVNRKGEWINRNVVGY